MLFLVQIYGNFNQAKQSMKNHFELYFKNWKNRKK